MKEKSIQVAKRVVTYCLGLFIMAVGGCESSTTEMSGKSG